MTVLEDALWLVETVLDVGYLHEKEQVNTTRSTLEPVDSLTAAFCASDHSTGRGQRIEMAGRK